MKIPEFYKNDKEIDRLMERKEKEVMSCPTIHGFLFLFLLDRTHDRHNWTHPTPWYVDKIKELK